MMTTRIIDNSGADKIFVDFMYKRPKENLEEFRKGIKERIVPRKLEVIEINPPQDGIAYIGKDFMHLSMSEGRGGFFDFERYWDKDGNPIGFGYKGQQYMFDKEKLPERDRELRGRMTVNDSWAERVVSYLTGFLPKDKLETFRKNYSKENVIEHNPPFNGIAYSCAYRCHTMVTKPTPNGRGEAKSSYADIVQYWDKDGNCIGFMFQGKKYMFDKEKLPEQARDTIVQGFRDGQSRILSKVPENSELAKYLEQYPDAILTPDSKWGWITKLPEGSHPEARITAQRIKVWDKNGQYLSVIKGMQKEM